MKFDTFIHTAHNTLQRIPPKKRIEYHFQFISTTTTTTHHTWIVYCFVHFFDTKYDLIIITMMMASYTHTSPTYHLLVIVQNDNHWFCAITTVSGTRDKERTSISIYQESSFFFHSFINGNNNNRIIRDMSKTSSS